MELTQAIEFARDRRNGVLVTIRGNGRPQLSNLLYVMDEAGVATISITEDRAKTKNLRRDARATLYVPGDSHWSYAVIDGTVELAPIAEAPDDATVDALVDYYRRVSGEHDDWDDYRRAMVAERRLVARFTPEHAYGALGR